MIKYGLLFLVFFCIRCVISIPKLTYNNGSFYDDENRLMVFHGVNLANKREPYTLQHIWFDDRNAKFINSFGHNLVRLGIPWVAIEPQEKEYNKTFLTSIFNTIDMLQQYGIYTLLDIHEDGYSEKHGGYGFPNRTALGKGPPNIVGFPLILFGGIMDNVSDIVDNDFTSFWNNENNIQYQYYNMIEYISKEIANQTERIRDAIIGIDIMNEPFPTNWSICSNPENTLNFVDKGCDYFDKNILTGFYANIIKRVKSVNSDLVLFFEPLSIFGLGAPSYINVKYLQSLSSNIGLSWHNYYPMNYSIPFNNVNRLLDRTNVGNIMTEFGANMNDSKWYECLELADSYMSSWTYWAYSNNPAYNFSSTYNILPPAPRLEGIVLIPRLPLNGLNVNKRVKLSVSHPYPRKISGVPKYWNFDKDTYNFSFTYRNGGNITEISVPLIIYEEGYNVECGYMDSKERVKCIKGDNILEVYGSLLMDISVNITKV